MFGKPQAYRKGAAEPERQKGLFVQSGVVYWKSLPIADLQNRAIRMFI
jgi:hypothetical protein